MIMNEDEFNDEMIEIGEKLTEAMIQSPPESSSKVKDG